MAHDFANAYAEIIKADENEDGTMTVYGKATDDAIDSDNQICDAAWLSKAMPEWFKSGGNIREQHSNIAAGVAKEYEAKSDGHYISALVVDPNSVKKVKTGVLKGFSIGIRAPRVVRDQKAANGRIIDGHIVEVSLVDRPANPNAKLIMAKSVEGESTLVQVEELHEYSAPLPSDVVKNISLSETAIQTEKGSKMETLKQITELAKSLTPDSVAEHNAELEVALKAISELIVKEETPTEEIVEKSDDSCDCDCDACSNNKGCDAKMCKCNTAKSEQIEAPVEVDAEKSDEAEVVAEAVVEETTPENSEVNPSEPTIEEIVEQAVKSAMKSVEAEIASLKAEKESAVEKSVKLESDLATALEKTVANAPKRTATKTSNASQNDNLVKAYQLIAKADASTDPILSEGYRALANDAFKAAGVSQSEDNE